MVGCGDIATQEALAATALLREHFPDLKIRFVNVVDLYTMTPPRSTRTASPTATSTRCSRPTSRSSSTSTATRG
jgi:phosphoketolase